MLKRHEVEILLKAGHAKTEVARLSGLLLRSVKRIAEERPVEPADDARERVQRQIGRPSRVTNFRKQVVEIVRETPDLASLEILRRPKESGYPHNRRKTHHQFAIDVLWIPCQSTKCPRLSILVYWS